MEQLGLLKKDGRVLEIVKAMGFESLDEMNDFFAEDNRRYFREGYRWGPRADPGGGAGLGSSWHNGATPWNRDLMRRERLLKRALAGEKIPREMWKIPRDSDGNVLRDFYDMRLVVPGDPFVSVSDDLRRRVLQKLGSR